MLVNTRSNLIEDTKRIFKGNENATLPSVLQDWIETLKEDTKNHLYNNSNETIFNFIETEKSDEITLLDNIVVSFILLLRLFESANKSLTCFNAPYLEMALHILIRSSIPSSVEFSMIFRIDSIDLCRYAKASSRSS